MAIANRPKSAGASSRASTSVVATVTTRPSAYVSSVHGMPRSASTGMAVQHLADQAAG